MKCLSACLGRYKFSRTLSRCYIGISGCGTAIWLLMTAIAGIGRRMKAIQEILACARQLETSHTAESECRSSFSANRRQPGPSRCRSQTFCGQDAERFAEFRGARSSRPGLGRKQSRNQSGPVNTEPGSLQFAVVGCELHVVCGHARKRLPDMSSLANYNL